MSSPRPGWYPDPHVAKQMRWWDGSDWTADTYERVEPIEDWTRPAAATSARSRVAGAAAVTTADAVPIARWWPRAGARLLDLAITSAISWLVAFPQSRAVLATIGEQFADAMRAAESGAQPAPFVYDADTLRALAIISLAGLGVTLAYEMVFLLWKAATPGKLALGLRVRRLAGDRALTPDVVLRRWLGFEALSSLPYVGTAYAVVDLLWPVRDAHRQALHDKVAGTCVVTRRR